MEIKAIKCDGCGLIDTNISDGWYKELKLRNYEKKHLCPDCIAPVRKIVESDFHALSSSLETEMQFKAYITLLYNLIEDKFPKDDSDNDE